MLKKMVLVCVAMLMPLVALAEESFQAGKHYIELPQAVKTADPAKVEVVEMFGYPCPHCNSFEPVLHSWEQKVAGDVDFKRIPVVFGRSWEPFARAYYTAELMKVLDKTHQATFSAVHVERRRLRSQEDLAELYGKLGVDSDKFNKYFNSFAVNAKLNQGNSKARSYEITGVPSLVVNGKYRVTAASAGGQAKMLEVVNFLIEKERKALAKQ
ncbi:thiol:disulfide interchange protein DsbA/DsbL [Marinobacterium arenosum]|uniref:thiol:disulfide interchange protein DsbA/DsbL n=1 Tax=Marinobacterium arenosum TaxID=2862496 RepID=UPI001C96BF94|nr:thiol:disulfide interchange protein DsbA/DsbL [Marinobacterium arenosum]MBY4678682.1 thiol:disulfide interchange protein DsbA/DsbL [Marinobacterium arenosum]